MNCRTPKILLASALTCGLLFAGLPAQADEVAGSHDSGPLALLEGSPSGQRLSVAEARIAATAAAAQSLAVPPVHEIVERYQDTAGNLVSTATTEAMATGGFAFGYWGELTEAEERILDQIEALWPQDSDDWTEEQWEAFAQTDTGQQIEALFEEFNDLMLKKLPEESRLLLEAMEALLPLQAEDWDEDQWDAFYETEDGQEFLRLLDEFFNGIFDDEDNGISDEEQAFWDLLETLLPEGNEDWDDQDWEDFYQTDDGKEFLRLLDEYYGFDDNEQDEAFWDALMEMLPEGSEDWDDEAWDAYYGTEAGRQLLEFVLSYELDNVHSEQELEELLEFYREILGNHSQWLEVFLLQYFEAPAGPQPEESHAPPSSPTPATEPAKEPTQHSAPPSQMVPVANPDPSEAHRAKQPAPTEAAAVPHGALAATGATGLAMAGVGTALLAVGMLTLRLRRKAAHKA